MNQVTVENDMAVITSQHILSQVVQRLDLQTSIYLQGRFKNSLQFNGELPFELKFDELNAISIQCLEGYANAPTIAVLYVVSRAPRTAHTTCTTPQ